MDYTFYIYSPNSKSMIRTRFKKVLLVSPDVFPDQLLTDFKNVKHIASVSSIFPSLFELNPDLVVFDYDYIGSDIEKVLRRIKINKFYSKLKIYCYKNSPNEKTDSLLKALGVDQFFYTGNPETLQKDKAIMNNFSRVFDASLMKWVANASN